MFRKSLFSRTAAMIKASIDHGEEDDYDELNETISVIIEEAQKKSLLPLVPQTIYPPGNYLISSKEIITNLMAVPKGIFLFDDDPKAVGLKLATVDLMNTVKNRKKMYAAFINAVEPQHISGVILSEELLEYSIDETFTILETLQSKGILFGVRVDKGVGPLSENYKDECRTNGLDNLQQRLIDHKELGCKFAKWRTVFRVSSYTPSTVCLSVNCRIIGKFAAIAQSLDILPIIEIELITYKSVFDMSLSAKVLEKILASVVGTLSEFNVPIESVILQMSMPQCANGCKCGKVTANGMANRMLVCLKRTLPIAIGGVTILSGDMSEEMASLTFSALIRTKAKDGRSPWPITFAFGKALTHSAIQVWDKAKIILAQDQFKRRVAASAIARMGKYHPNAVETVAKDDTLPMGELVH